jgi:hypothetical protein
MELRSSFSFLALASFGAVMAQPTIDLANNQPISGQEFVLQTSNTWSTAGPTGANVMFGFWDLSATGNRNYRVFDASITSTAATSIPTANMLSTDGGTDTLFWNYAADGLYQVGSRSGLEGLVSYSDPILELKYRHPIHAISEPNDRCTEHFMSDLVPPLGRSSKSGFPGGRSARTVREAVAAFAVLLELLTHDQR